MQTWPKSGDVTPAQAQLTCQTPAAPQRQHNPVERGKSTIQPIKLQQQTPSISAQAAACATAERQGTPTQPAQTSEMPAVGQRDVKVLIQQEFARLMATNEHTPNQAAILAVKHVSGADIG